MFTICTFKKMFVNPELDDNKVLSRYMYLLLKKSLIEKKF